MWKNNSMDAPILNMFLSSSSSSKVDPSTKATTWAWAIKSNYSKPIIKRGWFLSFHIQLQGGLHFHTPHNSQQLARIWNKDPTLGPTYCELHKNQMISKIVRRVLSPSQPLATCSFSRDEGQYSRLWNILDETESESDSNNVVVAPWDAKTRWHRL